MGTAARPGPGFYPVIVGIFAVIVLVSVTAIAFRGGAGAGTGGAAPTAGLEEGARGRGLAPGSDLGGGAGGLLSRAALGRLSGDRVRVRHHRAPIPGGRVDVGAAHRSARFGRILRTLRGAPRRSPAPRSLVS